MEKLLIVDGHNLLWQMFCGMPSRIVNEDGRAIQGTLGFVGALIKIIKLMEPTNIIVLFDGEHENHRTELSGDYKANRDIGEPEDDMFLQLRDVRAALDFMKIKNIEIAELVEADDVISSYAFKYKKDIKIVISSFDSDFFQLIGENVSILRYRGKETVICDIRYVKDKFGILPGQYADFKSLTGDTADNIKGAEKIGLKTAAALINQFGNLQDIIINAEKITKPSIRDSILRNTERLQTNYKLIKLDDRATIPLNLNELAYIYNGITTREVLKGIKLLNELGN
jgi:DNA polymerase-1